MKHIHFVGIGGIGMSGLAEVLHGRGFVITGSDTIESENTRLLQLRGIPVHIGHRAELVNGADIVVYSSAVNPDTNPETLEARRRGIPLIRRAELLAHLTRLGKSLAVAGTHGKTTTTSLCGLVLIAGGFDPTVVVGGRLHDFGGSNARIGNGEWFVVEADEYDRSFLQLTPTIAVITNVEAEHLDVYHTARAVEEAFIEFAQNVSLLGALIVCGDDAGCRRIVTRLPHRTVTYGLSQWCDLSARPHGRIDALPQWQVLWRGKQLGSLQLMIPGEHNVVNALASIAVGLELGIPFELMQAALANFRGVRRRFEILGQREGITVVDDYAHHPTEIRATLAAARQVFPGRRIIAVFQPHTYTRTRDFAQAFADELSAADIAIVTDVYPAREAPIEGISGETIIRCTNQAHLHYAPTFDDVQDSLNTVLRPGDVLLTLGAGNIVRIAEWALNRKS